MNTTITDIPPKITPIINLNKSLLNNNSLNNLDTIAIETTINILNNKSTYF